MSEEIKNRVLIADDDEVLCDLLKDELKDDGFIVDVVFDGKDAIEKIGLSNYDLLLLDLEMQKVSGEDVLKYVLENKPMLQIIVLTGKIDIRTAVKCMKLGAYDFVTKPYDYDQLLVRMNQAIKHKELIVNNAVLRSKIERMEPGIIIGESDKIKSVLELGKRAAISDSNILVQGETGTGKELFAEYLHKNSNRSQKPFITINCASLPDQLIETELFGHEKGAFTDAKTGKQGLVEVANDGTLFLDEIGELSIAMQPKLLRFLEKGEFRRVGGVQNLKSNVRIIAATNRILEDEVELGNFRRDLLYRLNVITLTVPALSERLEDVPILANFFLQRKCSSKSPKRITGSAINTLMDYNFPGNIRELQHIIERAIIFSQDEDIKPEDLALPGTASQVDENFEYSMPNNILKIEELEKIHYRNILEKYSWNRVECSLALGVSQKTLYSKIKKYKLKRYAN
ncbi:MAG: sigma-54 dependent transcriptional regulator [Melioribacteraceae bacterium]|nr:sigma-54 dependent transcriptional regulator [Melioribacteraceae bacterium]